MTGATRHYIAHIEDGELRKGVELPKPASVEIRPEDGAFFLLYLDEHGTCLADTWHETLERAQAQAQHELGIAADDWLSIT